MSEKIKYRNHHEFVLEELKAPGAISAYLEIALEDYEKDGDIGSFIMAIRTIAEAKGGINVLAEKLGKPRQTLYKALSLNGNPRLDTIMAIIKALGYHFTLEPLKSA